MTSLSLPLPATRYRATHKARWRGMPALALATVACAALAGLLAVGGPLALGAALALFVAVAVAVRPVAGAYLLVAVTPLVVGIDRGNLIPVLRPSEALAALVAGALVARLVWAYAAGREITIRWTSVDTALTWLVVTGTVLPLAWLVIRGHAVATDDLQYALTLPKYFVLYLAVRSAVRTEEQVRRCLWAAVGAGCVVAVIGVLQALQLLGVPALLADYFAPLDNARALTLNRGTSTIAQVHGAAVLLAVDLALVVALWVRGAGRRWVLAAAAGTLLLGTLATGTATALIALLVGAIALGLVTGRVGRLSLGVVGGMAAGAMLLRPVLDRRLATGGQGSASLSWSGRLDNLRTFFLPDLVRDYNWVFGVRPAARVPAPEAWRQYVFIESGHVWLLWIGGIPFLIAFCWYAWTTMRGTWRTARARADAVGVAAIAAFTAAAVTFVLMGLDPHLTLRGSADITFMLLGLATAAVPLAVAVPAVIDLAAYEREQEQVKLLLLPGLAVAMVETPDGDKNFWYAAEEARRASV